MTAMQLVRPVSAKAWDLRAAWAAGWRVSARTDIADCERLEGIVTRVAATDAYAHIAGRSVPLDRVLSVHQSLALGRLQGRQAVGRCSASSAGSAGGAAVLVREVRRESCYAPSCYQDRPLGDSE
jgi:hypothetical protein